MTQLKKPYNGPCTKVLRIAPVHMLATSGDPELHTTDEKVSTDDDALVKRGNNDIWNDDWDE